MNTTILEIEAVKLEILEALLASATTDLLNNEPVRAYNRVMQAREAIGKLQGQ